MKARLSFPAPTRLRGVAVVVPHAAWTTAGSRSATAQHTREARYRTSGTRAAVLVLAAACLGALALRIGRWLATVLLATVAITARVDAGQYPEIVDDALQIRTDVGAGWGVWTDGGLLTARHVVSSGTMFEWRSPRQTSGAVVRQAYANTDLAVLTSDAPVMGQRARFARQAPLAGDPVYYRCYLQPGAVPSVRRGWYLGRDSEGILHVDGGGGPGASGSGLYTETGEIVGIIVAGRNPGTKIRSGQITLQQGYDDLADRSNSRADIMAVSLIGGMPKDTK